MEKKVKEHNESTVKTAIETKQYEDQIYFLQKLKKLVDDHYKNIYKGYKYTKEEEICKQLKLNSKEQMDLKITRELKNQVKALYEMNEDNHYNILVLGRSGVGKSTLINVVLDLKGEDAAIENAVKPQIEVNEKGIVKSHSRYTPKEYRSEKSSIVLLDSRGIELSKVYNIDVAMKEIKEFIEERNGIISDPDKFIHCIWYLVRGERFEDIEGEYVRSLSSIYNDFGLPIIFVYTRAIDENQGNLIEGRIKECIGEKTINFIQIIARDIEVIRKKKIYNIFFWSF